MLLDAHKYASEDTIPQHRAFLRSIDNSIMRDKTGIINLFCMAYVLIKRNWSLRSYSDLSEDEGASEDEVDDETHAAIEEEIADVCTHIFTPRAGVFV